MSLERALPGLIRAILTCAEKAAPCEITPGELQRDYGGPSAQLIGKVMHDWLWKDAVLNALERHGVAARYERRRRVFVIRRLDR